MNSHVRLFGLYVPGDSVIHRAPVWSKYLIMFGFGLAPFLVGSAWFSIGCLIVSVALLVGMARLPVISSMRLGLAFWLIMGMLISYHSLMTSWSTGAIHLLNVIAAIYFARLLTMTTPVSELMDAIASGVRPLRMLGVNPEKVALAIALMWRSVPYLLGSVSDIRDAVRARGLKPYTFRFIAPAIIGAVGYALTTGDALRARGLDERAGLLAQSDGRSEGVEL